MATDLERYGVFALIFVVLLIVGISIWGPQREEEPLLAVGESSAAYQVQPEVDTVAQQGVSTALLGDPLADGRTESLTAFYKVRGGDNPTKIALRLYGADRYVADLMKANPGVRAERLQPGDLLRLPQVDKAADARYIIAEAELGTLAVATVANLKRDPRLEVAPSVVDPQKPTPADRKKLDQEKDPKAPVANGQRYHIVRSGERLEKIAKHYYGNAGSVAKIQAANPNLKNPDLIRAGMKLILP